MPETVWPAPAKTASRAQVRVLSVLVQDGQNTLTKVAGAIRRRGFHIRGMSIGPTRHAGRSRITLEVDHGHAEADQVRKQLDRVVEVLEVEDLTNDDVHTRELVVATVSSSELARLIQRGAKVITESADGKATIEYSGDRDEIADFVEELARHGIVDVVRSGPLVMRRTT